jgi:DNA-binding CsgD family transcriptional regulator
MPPPARRTTEERRPRALSQREREVLALVARGKTNREIGAALGVSRGTVKGHLRRIFVKIGAVGRTEASAAALRPGKIPHEPGAGPPAPRSSRDPRPS